MTQSSSILGRSSRIIIGLLTLALLLGVQVLIAAEDAPVRLLDQLPFDRVTLDEASGGDTIDTLLLDLPNRQVPDPLPQEGELELRRLSEPSVLYKVAWNSVAKIERFEDLLLAELKRLVEAKQLVESYEYLDFLYHNYPSLPGLADVTQLYLRQDALEAYARQDYEETLAILLSLYETNPQLAGLDRFVQTVTDRLIESHLEAGNFAAARGVVDSLEEGFSRLQLTNVAAWRQKFEASAGRQLASARDAMADGRFLEARQAITRAQAILPTAAGAEELLTEIDRRSPQLLVGVDVLVSADSVLTPLDFASRRVMYLTNPSLMSLVDFGAEGGIYDSPWTELKADDTGLLLDLRVPPMAIRQGVTPARLSLALLRQADTHDSTYRSDFAGLLDSVELREGDVVRVALQRSHVRPESLLTLPLSALADSTTLSTGYEPAPRDPAEEFVAYSRSDDTSPGPETIVEQFVEQEERAISHLLSGELDCLASVPPWQRERLEETAGVLLGEYRLPTVHVLLPNYEKPLMRRREFRRALSYGIDRKQILDNILLGGQPRRGFQVLSGPLPAGQTLTDPVAYAYDQNIKPRNYEPRLAALLATVSRNSLAKQAVKQQQAETAEAADGADSTEEAPEVDASSIEVAEIPPLVLAYLPNPVATTVCQSIKLQLDAIGLRTELLRLPPDGVTTKEYDLRYAQLAIWEPIVDARRLLGPGGVAGNCSSSMSLALQQVDLADNWKDARARLSEVHRIAFNDLQVIPLWQTYDSFAYRENLQGVGERPVSLYQNVADWRRVVTGGGR